MANLLCVEVGVVGRVVVNSAPPYSHVCSNSELLLLNLFSFSYLNYLLILIPSSYDDTSRFLSGWGPENPGAWYYPVGHPRCSGWGLEL